MRIKHIPPTSYLHSITNGRPSLIRQKRYSHDLEVFLNNDCYENTDVPFSDDIDPKCR